MNLCCEMRTATPRHLSIHELQESLRAARGVLGPSTIVAVGEQHDQPCLPEPFAFTGSNEIINDDLKEAHMEGQRRKKYTKKAAN